MVELGDSHVRFILLCGLSQQRIERYAKVSENSGALLWFEQSAYVGYTLRVESLLPAAPAVGGRGVHGIEMYAL